MIFKIKNRDNKILGVINYSDLEFSLVSDDPGLTLIFKEIEKNGIAVHIHDLSKNILKNDSLFPVALTEKLRKEGYVVDDWDDLREEIRAELVKYPEDDYVKELRLQLDSMSRLELSYLMKLLKSANL